ncbi:MAG: L,D-transpeptidase [Alphaproteobacteria bacterium]|nr:MAG: L,D-transpeptidase [Alphaproteobacteria bacterium]
MNWRNLVIGLAGGLAISALSILPIQAQTSSPARSEIALSISPAKSTRQPRAVERAALEDLTAHYAARRDGRYRLPALDISAIDPKLLRQRVPYRSEYAPGTIVIDSASRFLYLIEENGTALRYAVAVGKPGFSWTGEGQIARTSKWPSWTPPGSMIRRQPSLRRWRHGMPGSPKNPLGARALYIYFGERDSLYRIHGTNNPKSIGTAASSGCFRMFNHDVIDLYQRIERGARVVVM